MESGKKEKKRRTYRTRLKFRPFSCEINIVADEEGGQDSGEAGDDCEAADPLSFLSSLLPREVRSHLKGARIEMLKAIRAALDERIRAVEKGEDESRERVEKVRVEVEEDET